MNSTGQLGNGKTATKKVPTQANINLLTSSPTTTLTYSPTPTSISTYTPSPIATPMFTPSPGNGSASVAGVVNGPDNLPLEGVTVTIAGSDFSDSASTGGDGSYVFKNLTSGNYNLTYEKKGYQKQTQNISIDGGETKDIGTITMKLQKGKIYGNVVSSGGNPIASVTLKLKGEKTKVSDTISSHDNGYFEFTDLEVDTYVILATKKGYKRTRRNITLGSGESKEVKIKLEKKHNN